MTHGKKHFLALLLALILCVSLFPAAALAEEEGETGTIAPAEEPEEREEPQEGTIAPAPEDPEALPGDGAPAVTEDSCGDDLTWDYDIDSRTLTISGIGKMDDWTTVDDIPWYRYSETIETVRIEEGVTSIGDIAFYQMDGLKSASLPSTLTAIGRDSFAYCRSLTSVSIPAGVTTVEEGTFQGCSALESVTLPSTLTGIGKNAFAYCSNLKRIKIPEGVTAIEYMAFGGCFSLSEVKLPSTLTKIEEYAFCDCNLLQSISIPAGVTVIGDSAFAFCYHLADLTLPSSLTSIGTFAFEYCELLTSVTIPENVSEIGQMAFFGCSSLTAIHVAEGNASFSDDNGILYNKDGTRLICSPGGKSGYVTVRAQTTTIGEAAFYCCDKITRVTLPDGLDAIESRAFFGCSGLTEITLPASLTSVGCAIFGECGKLTDIRVAEGNECFCASNGILFDKEMKTLLSFPGGKSGDVIIPVGVETIDDVAFGYCEKLTSVVFPYSLRKIGDSSFIMCTGLNWVRFMGNAPTIEASAFAQDVITAFYPEDDATWTEEVRQDYSGRIGWAHWITDSVSGQCGDELTWTLDQEGNLSVTGTGPMWNWSYDEKAPWADYWGIVRSVELSEGVTEIGDWAFSFCGALKQASFPSTLTRIGEMAFLQCKELSGVSFPNGLQSIGGNAFDGCHGLTEIVLPDSLTEMGNAAFSSCSMLESVKISAGLTTIQNFSFHGSALRSVVVPEGVTSIGVAAFESCSFLSDVTLPESLTELGDYTFAGCTSLTKIKIPSGVTTIGVYLLSNCRKLKEVWFTGEAPTIGEGTFYYVTATAYYPADDATWTEDVRKNYGGTVTWKAGAPNPFTDVKEGKYYYNAVLWAFYGGITKGTDDTHFSPNQTCTRAQIVTFLWNAFGQPEPSSTENPFVDVKPGKYYTKAVLWAVEKGITKGTDATHFGTNDPCSRAQVVTFLWNAYGKPEPGSTDNPFVDVKAGKYYYKAVLWAVEMGITKGVDATHFGVNNTCTRGQVVTFLYAVRDYEKP